MKEWYARADAQGDWVIAGKHRFKVVPLAGRRTLDKHGLADELSSLMRDQGIALDVPALFAKHEKQGAPASALCCCPSPTQQLTPNTGTDMDYSSNVALCLNRAAESCLT